MSHGECSSGLTDFLAARVLTLGDGHVPDDVYIRAQHALLDWTVLATVSWRVPSVQSLYRFLVESGAPAEQATMLGAGIKTSSDVAMLVNGAAGHVLDFDDAHLLSRVHPSAPLWPAILAYGEMARLPGERLLAAFAIGVEVQSRLAAYMGESHYRLGWHNTATLGTFGAAAAVGWLRGLNHDQLCNAFAIAATMASGLRAAFGSPTKALQVARASGNGMLAAGLAQAGLSAGRETFDREDGFSALYADSTSAQRPLENPDRWCIKDSVFKYHASCYGTQAPIEAALLFGRPGKGRVSSVTVYVEPQYMTVCNIPDPATATEAKFSVRHAVALALSGKNTAVHASFEPETIRDAEVTDWRSRIEVRPDERMPRANARVELTFVSGDRDARTYDASRPESDLDRQQEKLLEKTRSLLTQSGFDRDQTTTLQDALLSMRQSSDVSQWAGYFRQVSSAPALRQEHDRSEGA